MKYIKIWFSSARKKLIKNFVNSWMNKHKILDIFSDLSISENTRPDALDIFQWTRLVEELWKI
jgi:16S rRNA A1518/A1519 N6-dimethyltransferase RsmA/KsgA/DIM1 with predicted DNA glycosylase/AP lyase activity